MALAAKAQLKFWGIAALALVIAFWLVGDVLTPFILGAAIAYLLDPIADWFEAQGLGRTLSTVVIMLSGLLVMVIAILLVVPTLAQQAGQLIGMLGEFFQNLPEHIDRLNDWLGERVPTLSLENEAVREQLATIGETLQSNAGMLIGSLASISSGIINIVLIFVITPVVTFYLLMDWDRMIAKVDDLLPRDHAPVIRELAAEIDTTLSGFLRGMGSVCFILGAYYAIALMAVGLNFGLIVGVVAGVLTFIPYVGAIVGGGLAIGLAFFQYWNGIEVTGADGSVSTSTDWVRIVVVYAIFQSGQIIEGNFLTPKLVGSSVGLHPVWLLLALSVFGALFGFVGMLVAVPLAAVIGVLIRFGVAEYKNGRLYRGHESEAATDAALEQAKQHHDAAIAPENVAPSAPGVTDPG